ncbi:MAG: DUF1501 domain-containing protein, partial [Verrucomicrobiota bacterium]
WPGACPGPSMDRREWLRVGGLGALGLALPQLLPPATRAAEAAGPGAAGSLFGRARSCILLFLAGGPPQHETFDPKPDAPSEVRDTFRAIPTRVPGLHFCETLPYTARVAHRLTVLRSMTTEIDAHSTSGAFMLTGYEPATKAENVPPGPQDWPSLAAVVGALKPSTRSPMSSVVLPEILANDGNIVWPGQDGGFMGPAWSPLVMRCDPSVLPMRIEGLERHATLPEVRVGDRQRLWQQLDAHFQAGQGSAAVAAWDHAHQKAFDLLHADASRRAFDLEREPAALRAAYGGHKFGQSVLLARRLIEAGTRLVQVNWPREGKAEVAGSPLWDTHAGNASRVRDVLCPQFDRTFATLVDDLADRGMLDETLVIAMGEFGRSPKINAAGGRDHWGACFSLALAGGGVPGGLVVGASDRLGGYPASRPVRPRDLAATIFHLLGLSPNAEFLDPLGRPRPITDGGLPLREIVGA